jgi:hypothetical protein
VVSRQTRPFKLERRVDFEVIFGPVAQRLAMFSRAGVRRRFA